ncbi:MAG: response regulator [Ruminiclostridium sp.]|nr:response regulator [Ruminiclostridium sp.]
MSTERILFIGGKETVLLKIFMKKVKDSGIDNGFSLQSVDAVNAMWAGTTLVTMYLETGLMPSHDVVRFLIDKLTDEGKQMIIIGDAPDIAKLSAQIPEKLIYKTFTRPLDNEGYIKTVTELFEKKASGEFKKSILIVDDDPSYLNLVREWLKDEYKVSIVTSGMQAIKWLGKNSADLILLDYEMPVTSGPQVFEMLRSDEDTKDIPVIFLTGKSDKDSVLSVVAMKPDGYFLKNVEKKELLDKLDKFFKLSEHKVI